MDSLHHLPPGLGRAWADVLLGVRSKLRDTLSKNLEGLGVEFGEQSLDSFEAVVAVEADSD